MSSAVSTDRIEKEIVLRASRSRVWRALTDSAEFGRWFGVKFDSAGPFTAGSLQRGHIVPTEADAEVAKAQQPYLGTPFEIVIDRVEPERLFSFRWHPFAIEKNVDYSSEPTTLIEFTLDQVADGTKLTVAESGFDRIPLERRAKALAANEQGWGMMVNVIEKYVGQSA
jgi:uncharacterized protein YndB with AHSA1/START domain